MILVLSQANLRGQDVRDTVKLEAVTVKARQTKEIIPAQTLSGGELERLSSFSVADAMRYFSGVQIKDYGGIGGLKTVNVRSLGSQHVGVFYDGIQIGNAQNGTVDLGKFTLDNMEMLSVYNGQRSSIFQSAKDFASASAVYMVSRRPKFARSKKNNLTFKAKSGSFGLFDASVLWERRLGEKISSSANIEFLTTSGKYRFRYAKTGGYDTVEVRRNGDVTFLRAEAALFGRVDRGEWQVKAYYYGSERGYPGAAVKKDEGIALLNEDRQKDRNYFVQGSLRRDVCSWYSYRIRAKYAYDYMHYLMPPETTVQPMNNHYWQQEVYATAANLFTITDHWSANLSVDAQWNRLDARGTDMFDTNFVQPRRYTLLGAAATSFSLPRFSVQGSLLYTFVYDRSARDMPVAPAKGILSPTLIASAKPFRRTDLTVRAFYKNIFRMPTFNDLYYVQIGNRLLKPEYTTQYDVGAAWSKNFAEGFLASVECSLDGYFNRVKDKIIATPTSNQLVWTMLNLGYVEIAGVDAGVNSRFRIWRVDLNARITYTFQSARDLTEEKRDNGDGNVIETYGNQIPYIPWHSGSAIVGADWKGWSLNYSFIYTGDRYRLGGNVAVNYIQPWYTHDMSLSKTVALRRAVLRATAEVNNIFNQQYEVVRWYPMPGTNFKIILSITL